LRTPAPGVRRAAIMGRHPQTFTKGEILAALRANVFRFAPESGHRALQSPCLFRAMNRHQPTEMKERRHLKRPRPSRDPVNLLRRAAPTKQ
jgi:hypothetical protein